MVSDQIPFRIQSGTWEWSLGRFLALFLQQNLSTPARKTAVERVGILAPHIAAETH